MKIEKLALNKTKVTLDTNDLVHWDIPVNSLRPDSPRLKDFIISLIRQADSETGFLGDRASIMIEATPHANGFVFVLTSTDMIPDSNNVKDEVRRKLYARQFKVVKKGLNTQPKSVILYQFDSFDDVYDLLHVLKLEFDFNEITKQSRLYRLNNNYYLRLAVFDEKLNRVTTVVNEFGRAVKTPHFEAYLAEHAKLIADYESIKSIG